MTAGLEADLDTKTLHSAIEDAGLASMNFLNEIAGRYPDAVAFAAGRPSEEDFDIADLHDHLRTYSRHLIEEKGLTEAQMHRMIFQYGATKGIIRDLVARNLLVDEGITADPESIVVTVGCQEAMFLVLRALRAGDADALLAVSPTYIGLTGAAKLVDLPVLPVRTDATGIDLGHLAAQVATARQAGQRIRGCYVMPDFANPSGTSMDLETRRRLLDLAEQEDFLLLEDNPYGLFHFGDERLPTLKALDSRRRVVYLGSFAKTALPGARVGYVLADQVVRIPSGATELFADQLSKIKSMVTVNTSPVAQAIVGGKLIANDFSLASANTPARERYLDNMARIRAGLARRFPPGSPVTWNAPAGGFFVVVTVPFRVDDKVLEHSARDHGVLWTPMTHFYGDTGGEHQLRLSASVVTPAQIETGLDALADLICQHGVVRRTRPDACRSTVTG